MQSRCGVRPLKVNQCLYADAVGKNYAYRLIVAADRLPDAHVALGELAAPESLGPTVVRIPDRDLELPFSSNFRAGVIDVVPGRDLRG